MSSSQPIGIGSTAAANTYATLEIQAILPDSGDIWSWRGFSPEAISTRNFIKANIGNVLFIDKVNNNVGKTATLTTVMGYSNNALQFTGCVITNGGSLTDMITYAD